MTNKRLALVDSINDFLREADVFFAEEWVNATVAAFKYKLSSVLASVDRAIAKELISGQIDLADVRRADQAVKDAFGQSKAAFDEAITDFTVRAGKAGYEKTVQEFNLGINFKMVNEWAKAELEKHAFVASERTMSRLAGDIMATLTKCYDQGMGIYQMRSVVKQDFRDMRDYEVDRIARTETHHASQKGADLAYAEAKVEYKQWVTAHDDRVRGGAKYPDSPSDHTAMDGQIVRADMPFTHPTQGWKQMFPGDSSLGAPVSSFVNCRCRSRPFWIPTGFKAPEKPYFYVDELISATSSGAQAGIRAEYDEVSATQDFDESVRFLSMGELDPSDEYEMRYAFGDASRRGAMKDQTARKLQARLAKDDEFRSLLETIRSGDLRHDYKYLIRGRYDEDDLNLISNLIEEWACTSGDSSTLAVAIQRAAREEFGLPGDIMSHIPLSVQDRADQYFGSTIKGLRSFVRTQYNQTQEEFAAAGIKELHLYRGFKWDSSEKMLKTLGLDPDGVKGPRTVMKLKMELQPLSSFSSDPVTAAQFASPYDWSNLGYEGGMCFTVARVPVDQILATPRTGVGCLNEFEYVVIGGKDKVDLMAVVERGEMMSPLSRSKSEKPIGLRWDSAKQARPDLLDLFGDLK